MTKPDCKPVDDSTEALLKRLEEALEASKGEVDDYWAWTILNRAIQDELDLYKTLQCKDT